MRSLDLILDLGFSCSMNRKAREDFPQLRSITGAVLKRVLLSSPHFSWDVEHQGCEFELDYQCAENGTILRTKRRLFTLPSSAHQPCVGHCVLRRGTPEECTFLGALLQSPGASLPVPTAQQESDEHWPFSFMNMNGTLKAECNLRIYVRNEA